MQHKGFAIFILLFCLGILSMNAQHFVQNNGQWHDDVAYKMPLKNGAVYLKKNGIRFHLIEDLHHRMHNEFGGHKTPEGPIQNHVFDIVFNGTPKAVLPEKKQSEYHNYFLGKSENSWRGKVPLFENVLYQSLYPNIDLRLKSGQNNVKYDLILAPGANPADIKWTYQFVDGLAIENGKLIIKTSVGRVVEQAPIAWQVIDGQTVDVKVKFVLNAKNEVSFVLGKYDENHELIIDPNFVFSTYTGSTSDNFGFTATYDLQGNTYGGGIVFGGGYPTTTGAFQTNYGGNSQNFDVSISKFSQNGTQLIYSTYLGGNRADQPHSMVVDSLGNLHVIGATGSANFPVTPTAYDTTYNGGSPTQVGWKLFSTGVDMFVTKFSAAGDALLGSTFLGGTDADGANFNINYNYGDAARGEVIVAKNGDIFFANSTLSDDFPVTQTMAVQDTLSGDQDAVIGALNSDLSQLKWSTYFGGTADDAGYSLKLNSDESKVYVAGGTRSVDFPVSASMAHQAGFGGQTDGWIAAFNRASGTLISATYNGTASYDQNFFVELDREDEVYVFGQTRGNYPTSPGVWKVAGSAQFIQKFNGNLSQSLKSTVFGNGSHTLNNISPTALMVDECKSVYISGWGGSTNTGQGSTFGMPTTPNAWNTTTDGSDFYFLVLDGSWKFPEYATFFGGGNAEHVDGGTSRFSPDGTIYQAVCAGCGGNSSFPAFPSNVHSTTNNSSNCNLAVFKVEFNLQAANVDFEVDPDTVCAPYSFQYDNFSTNVDVYEWNFGDSTFATGENPSKVFTEPGFYTITLVGKDTLCNTIDTGYASIFLTTGSAQASFTADYDTCGRPFLVALNSTSTSGNIEWIFDDGTTSTQKSFSKIYNDAGPHVIKLVVQDTFCFGTDTATQIIQFKTSGGFLDFKHNYNPCDTAQAVAFVPFGSGDYQTFLWDFGDGDTSAQRFPHHTYAEPGNYTVKMTARDTICGFLIEQYHAISIVPGSDYSSIFPNVFSPNGDGTNDFWRISSNIAVSNLQQFHVEVYNRWGSRVFSSNNPAFLWDGKFDETDLAQGVYFYLVNFNDNCGNKIDHHGEVHILR